MNRSTLRVPILINPLLKARPSELPFSLNKKRHHSTKAKWELLLKWPTVSKMSKGGHRMTPRRLLSFSYLSGVFPAGWEAEQSVPIADCRQMNALHLRSRTHSWKSGYFRAERKENRLCYWCPSSHASKEQQCRWKETTPWSHKVPSPWLWMPLEQNIPLFGLNLGRSPKLQCSSRWGFSGLAGKSLKAQNQFFKSTENHHTCRSGWLRCRESRMFCANLGCKCHWSSLLSFSLEKTYMYFLEYKMTGL